MLVRVVYSGKASKLCFDFRVGGSISKIKYLERVVHADSYLGRIICSIFSGLMASWALSISLPRWSRRWSIWRRGSASGVGWRRGVLIILGSSGAPRVKAGLWIGSHWNWVLWISSVGDDFIPVGFV